MHDASMALLFLAIYADFALSAVAGLCLEETEVYATIHTLLYELGMLGKTVVLAVLEDEHAALAEHTLVEYEVGELGQACECIGGVGKDEVKGVVTLLDVAEYVGAEGNPTLFAQLLLYLIYKAMV